MTLDSAVKEAAMRIVETIPDLTVLDAHGLLVAIYTDPAMPISIRLEAARAALRVEKPALAATAVSGDLTLHVGVAERLGAARERLNAIPSAQETIEAIIVAEVTAS